MSIRQEVFGNRGWHLILSWEKCGCSWFNSCVLARCGSKPWNPPQQLISQQCFQHLHYKNKQKTSQTHKKRLSAAFSWTIENRKENGGAEVWSKEQPGERTAGWDLICTGSLQERGFGESEMKIFEVETVERWRAHCQEMGWRMDEAGTGITDKEGTIWML